jgi:uncharacterized cupin superfamily protein
MPDIVEERDFDLGAFSQELAAASTDVGTTLLFENERVRVWEVRLDPGTRCPFHAHTHPYFWTCVIAGTGRQRSGDGTLRVLRYTVGDTSFWEPSSEAPLLHDLENVGEGELRFVTVELR